MAIVFEDNLKKNIQSKNLLPVYILFGDDGYLKKNYADKLGNLTAERDDVFNYCRFEGGADLQEVYDAAMQMPFMGDKKFVELCDYDFEHCAKSDFEKLCTLLSEVPDTAVFVLRFDSLDFDSKKSAKFKRLVTACEKNNGLPVKLDHRKPAELVKMLTDGAAKRGCRMDSNTARYLIETAGEDINLLSNELTKLCAYSQKGSITKETVDAVSVKTVEASIYNLSKFILSANTAEALSCLDELFFMRIDAMPILYNISSIYVDMLRIFAAKEQGLKISDVAETFDYKNKAFLLDKAAPYLKKMDFKRLNLSLEAITEADIKLKSFGSDDRIILEQLIIKLIYILAKGEKVDKT